MSEKLFFVKAQNKDSNDKPNLVALFVSKVMAELYVRDMNNKNVKFVFSVEKYNEEDYQI